MASAATARVLDDIGPRAVDRRRTVVVCLAALTLLACHDRADDQHRPAGHVAIRVSILTRSPSSASTNWPAILAGLQAATGLAVAATISGDSAPFVQEMKARKMDAGLFSNASGLAAVRDAGGEVFARSVDAFGSDAYRSVLVVNARSGLTLERVLRCDRTLILATGEPLSMSGALAPMTYLFAPRNIRLSDCFKAVRGGGADQANLAQVASRQVEVATSSSIALLLDRLAGGRLANQLRVIWQSPPLPGDPIVWRRDLDPALKEKLRQFFLTYGQGTTLQAAQEREAMAKVGIGGFEPADDSHLLPYQEMAATQAWLVAKEGRDPGKIAAARRILDAITARRLALEARTREPAGAQP